MEAFHSEHSLNEPNLIILSDSISSNKKHKYFVYQFDNGGFGYSRVFWSVIDYNENKTDLEIELIPDGFKIIGWTNTNEMILEKWEPYYYITKTVLKSGMELNGVKIILAE